MAGIHWTNPVNGPFQNYLNWSNAVVPGAADDAILDAAGPAYTVSSLFAQTVGGLQTAANATLSVAAATFTINSGSDGGTDAGLIVIGNGASLVLNGLMDDSPGGTIQANGGGVVALANGSRVVGGFLTSVGSGVINAHGVSQYLTNVTLTAGSLLDVNNDDLRLNTSFVNNGTLRIANGSRLIDETGALTITGTGTIVLDNSANYAQIFGGQITFGSGQTIVGSGQLGVNQTIITNNNLFSVGGGGGLDIDVSGGNSGVGVGNGVGTNTASGLLNNGVIQATGASTLSFESGLYENAVGGVIQALAGSTINLNNDSRILNGALTSDATSIINAHNASQYLTNVTLTAGSVIDVNNDDLRLNTVFTNNGTLRISNASRLIDETGALTINGAGTIILDNSGNYAQLFGGTITFGAGQTVQGAGQLGVNQTIFVINNVFSANAGTTLSIDVAGGSGGVGAGNGVGANLNSGLLNNSTIQATGGSILSFESGLYENAANGVIQALSGSTVNLNNDARILNGFLTSVGSGVINAHGVSQYLTNVTLTAGSLLDVNNDDLRLNTSFVNNGTLRIANGSRLIDETGALTITGTGTIVLDNSANYAQIFGGQITFGSGQTIVGSGQLGVNQTIITNNNLFSVGGGGGLDIDVSGGNSGVGVGNGVGTNTASGLLNNGVIQATGASTLSFESGLYENAVGGVIQALAGSTINLNNDSRILNGALTSDATSIINAHNASQYLTNVTLTAGSVIDVNNDDLRLNTVFTNNGTLRISNASRLIDETGALTINGAGTIILDNSGNYAQLFGGTITFGAGQTVQGAGQLGVNQTIFVINNVFSANAGTTLSIDVAGGSGGVGAGNGVGANLNSGLLNNSTIQATGGSILSFESGLYENAANGVIQALSGSTVNLNNDARILNGFLTSVGSGVINAHGVSQYLTNVTLTAGSLLDVNNDDLRLNTSFVNNGTLRIANGSRLIDETGALTITGTGTIVLDNSANYAQIFGGQITFGSGQTIVGSGQLGVNQTIITNNNLFSVGGGGGLDIDVSGGNSGVGVGNGVGTNTASGLLNNGVIQATGASTLSFESGLYENAVGGVIQALAGSTINLNNDSRILNGALTSDATSIINAHNASQYLTNVTLTAGSVIDVNNDDLRLNTVFTNNGTLRISNASRLIDETGALTINGAGTIILDNSGNYAQLFGGTITFGVGEAVRGSGQLGTNQTVITNNGLISGDILNHNFSIDVSGGNSGVGQGNGVGTNTSSGLLNTGTIQAANGSILSFESGLYENAANGVIQALSGSTVNLNNDARILNGFLTSVGSGVINAHGVSQYLTNVTLTAGSLLDVNNDDLRLNTSFVNNGTLRIANGSRLIDETGALTITGTGTIVLDNSANYAQIFGGTITIGVGETVQGAGQLGIDQTLIVNNGLISGNNPQGTLDVDPAGGSGGVGGGLGAGGSASLLNTGTIQASGAGGSLRLESGQYDNSAGVIQAINGGSLSIVSANILGGTFATTNGGVLQVTDQGSTLDGRASAVTNTGVFTIPDADYLTIEGAVANNGVIALNGSESNTRLVIGGSGATLTGSGSIALSDNFSNSIQGAGGAVTFTNVSNTVVGAGQIGGNGLTLINGAAGVIDATGSNVLNIDTGQAAISNAGLIEATGRGGATIQSAVVNSGVLEANGGVLTVNAAVSGTGTGLITAGTLHFTSTFNENTQFTGPTGTLELANGQAYGGAIQGFSTHGAGGSDTLDLSDVGFTDVNEASFSGSASGGILTVTDGKHTASLTLTGANYTRSTFLASSDGQGGTLIVLNDMVPLTGTDSYSGNTGHPIIVSAAAGVLANDIDPNGLALSAVLAKGGEPAHGVVTLNTDGSFNYTPDAGYFGTDAFSYTAFDSTYSAAPTLVALTIIALPPTAGADSYGGQAGRTLVVTPATGVLSNDSDPNGLALSATLASGPAHGAATLNGDGSFTYTPNLGFAGTDTFTYAPADAAGAGPVTPVTINVIATPPVSLSDTFSVAAGQSMNVAAGSGVLANDTDTNGLALAAGLVPGGATAHGALTLNADGSFSYTPDKGFAGQDTFTYIASDGLSSGAATTATITVTAKAPTSSADAYGDRAGQTLVVDAAHGVLANDSDPNGLTPFANLAPGGAPAHGALTLNSDGSFTYTPNTGFVGQDAFVYSASDALSSSAPTTATITVTASAPTSGADAYGGRTGQTLIVDAGHGVLANDSDPNGLALSANLAPGGGPAHGALLLNPDGSFTYTPTVGYSGTDVFSYIASNGLSAGAATSVVVTIAAVQPVTVPDIYSAAAGQPLRVAPLTGVLANDTDPNGLPLTATLAAGGATAHGALTLNTDGSFVYVANSGFVGQDAFSYVASDAAAASDPTTVLINVLADGAPVTQPDNYSAVANQPLVVGVAAGVLSNDAVTGGGILTAAIAPGGQPVYGNVTLNPDGSFNYVLNVGFGGFVGADTFSYVASQGVQSSLPTTVTVSIGNGPGSAASFQPLIQETYDTFMGRDPTASETAVWQQLLGSGQNPGNLRAAVVGSAEGQAHTAAQTATIYETYMGRDPTSAEANVWRGLIGSGDDFGNLRSAVLASGEGQRHTTATLTSLYDTYFGRDPNASEVAVWQGLAVGGESFFETRAALVNSAEGQTHTAATVTSLYDTYFGRDPTPIEAGVWQNSIAGGGDFTATRAVLLTSPEGQGHTAAETTALYQTYFGRAPNASELSVWSGLIQGGHDFNQLRDTLERQSTSANVHHLGATSGASQTFSFDGAPNLVIDNFDPSRDRIQLSTSQFGIINPLDSTHVVQVTALDGSVDALINLDGVHSILLTHTSVANLQPTDFVFS